MTTEKFNRVGYLQTLCNKYGDFKVALSFKNKEGDTIWSKHRSVLECWESEAGLSFLGRVNHRQILKNEIVIDLDENINRFDSICKELQEEKYNYVAYFTGSRGYHIHILLPLFGLEPRWYREKIREEIIGLAGADNQKKADGVMIALENVPHWKTGKLKRMVKCGGQKKF